MSDITDMGILAVIGAGIWFLRDCLTGKACCPWDPVCLGKKAGEETAAAITNIYTYYEQEADAWKRENVIMIAGLGGDTYPMRVVGEPMPMPTWEGGPTIYAVGSVPPDPITGRYEPTLGEQFLGGLNLVGGMMERWGITPWSELAFGK